MEVGDFCTVREKKKVHKGRVVSYGTFVFSTVLVVIIYIYIIVW